jgi:hypothetical protein
VQFGVDDLARQPFDIAHDMGSRTGEADVGGIDAERIDQMQNANFLVDIRASDRRRLQPIAQRLIVQHHAAGRRGALEPVPVINQRMNHRSLFSSHTVVQPAAMMNAAHALA